MRYPTRVLPAEFIVRRNRFVAKVAPAGRRVDAFVPTTGRLGELLVPGAAARLLTAENPARKLQYDLAQVRYERTWVSVNAAQANRLFAEAIERKIIPALVDWETDRPEVRWGDSRFDWRLRSDARTMLVEVKSVTLVEDGRGLFPDAPTARGAKHARELAAFVRDGGEAAIAFVAQRADAQTISPHERQDPVFTAALREASAAGVRLIGLRCRCHARGVDVLDEIPVVLP